NEMTKREIEAEIDNDFRIALEGIKKLPMNSRLGVYVAYVYYVKLLDKIRNTPPQKVMQVRIRVPNYLKVWLLFKSSYRYYTNLF
ncbi:MAG: phytoene/squalene synthase family protein, partial [Bacteroidia bacterium]|nr:phytoene/squalene synthase family protein [Bacteroidia bacterium]